jgi:murein DD-endopeptidase MepM/ murein hydrolase activator NlpD
MDVDACANIVDRVRTLRQARVAAIALAMFVVVSLGPFTDAVTGARRAQAGGPGSFATCTAGTYTVVAGDFWAGIASRAKVSLPTLLTANKAVASTAIVPGSVVCLPAAATLPSPQPTSPTTTIVSGDAPNLTPVTTVAGSPTVPVIPLQQFPVQGPCAYIDTFGAPRSGGRNHEGVDLIARSGLYIYAAVDGTLTKKYVDAPGSLSGNGWRLTSADDSGTYFLYAHLSAYAGGLAVGSKVRAGQIIGFVGMTGDAGSPHLHFEVHPTGGAAIDPTPTVKAVDACRVSAVPAQPSGSVPAKAGVSAGSGAPASPVPATAPSGANLGSDSGRWSFLPAVVVLDTGGKRLVAGAVRTVKVTGIGSVPAAAPGVMVRITARNVAAQGFITVQPCGSDISTSTVNIAPGRANATMNVVKVVGGSICVYANVQTDVRLEVTAYASSSGVGVQAVAPKRALDTRTGAPIAAQGSRSVSLAKLGVSSAAKAVSVTVSIVAPAGAGTLAIGPCGGAVWLVPFGAASTQVFSGVIGAGASGLCVSSSAMTHVVLDVNGSWSGTNSLAPFGPQRLFDSRVSGAVGSNPVRVPLGVLSGTSTAQLTITIIGGATGAAVTAWNCNQAQPAASVGAADRGVIAAVSATMNVSGGVVCLTATSPAHVIVDATASG